MKTLRQHRTFLGWLMTGLMAVWLPGQNLRAADGSWILDGNGNWTGAPANWQGGIVPNGIGDIVSFLNNITGNRTVTLNAPITVGGLRIGDALGGNNFVFAGSAVNTLTLDNAAGNAFVNQFNSATTNIQAPLILTDNVDWNIFPGTLDVNGASNAQVSYTGAGNTIKNGAGALRLNIDAVSGAGYTGNWVVNFGTLNIGGANSATPTSLGTGTGGILLNGTGRADLAIFSLNNNGTGVDSSATYAGNNNVVVSGGATINVAVNYIAGANDRVTHILNDLTFNGGVFRTTSGNSHSLQFNGTTTLNGQTNVFDVLANGTATRSNLILNGTITDGTASRSLIKEGAGRMAILGSSNTYDGVTAIKNGVLQLGAGANLGGGVTYVNGGALSVSDAVAIDNLSTGAGLVLVGQLGTFRYILPVIGYSGSLDIDGSNPILANVPIAGMILGIDGVSGTSSTNAANIDLAQVGSGSNRVWLGNVIGFDRTYTGTLTNGVAGDLRITAGSNTLILSGANQLGGAAATNNLVFGYDHSTAVNFVGSVITMAQGGTVSVRANNANTLGNVTVHRGITLNINGTVTTPLGTGVVTNLGGTISTDNTSAAQFGNTDFRLYGGSTLLLDNAAVTTANTDRRLLNTTDLALNTSTLRLIGDGGAATASSQAVDDITYRGGSVISIDTDAAIAGRLTTLTANTLTRAGNGTLQLRNISNTATTFGTSTGTQKFIITTAPTVTNGMIGANIALWGGANANDAGQPLFVTYDGTHGIQAATLTATANAAALAAATTTQIADINGVALAVTGSPSVQALRIRSTANTHAVTGGTITIGSGAGVGQGAGLFLAHTSNNGVTHSSNFAFGSQEGLLYAATTGGTAGIITLSGVLSGSAGVTRFGDGILSLTGQNTFSGPLNINSGETRISQLSAGPITGTPKEIYLNGGSFYLQTGSARYNNNITVRDNSRLGNVNVGASAFNNLTIEARTGSTAPVTLWHQAQAGGNVTTAYGTMTLNGPANLDIAHLFQVNSGLAGTGDMNKYMNERLIIAGDSSGYTGNITSYTSALVSYTSLSTAKPFGNTNTITLNPGSGLTLASPTNINGGQVTMNSDHGGISYIGQLFVADPATALPAITVNSTAPWKGALALGAVGFSVDIDQSTLFGGDTYLGAALGYTGIYTGNLTPATAGYLLGTSQGGIHIARPLTGAFDAIIGLSMTGDSSRADQFVNNSGGVVQYVVPMTYTGDTIVNQGPILRISANNALNATGNLVLAGGQLRADAASGQNRMIAPISISNTVVMTADTTIQMENSPYDLRIGGSLQLAPGSTGVVRALAIGSDQPGGAQNNAGMVYLDGGISDGPGGSGNHFVKNGPGTLFFTGTNTYTGTTTIQQGLIGIHADTDWGMTTGNINMPGGGIAIWENSFTTSRNYSMHGGNGWFDVAGGLTLTQDAASTLDGTSFLMKRGLGTLVLNGNNSQTGIYLADGVLQVNGQASLGNPAEGGGTAIQFGNDQTLGGATAGTRYTGGTLRLNFTGTTNRGVAFNNNGNTNFSGGIDVTAGNAFTIAGVISQGTELDFGFKTGTGTLITTATNTWRGVAMTNGTLQFANSAPWANSTGTAADNTFIEMIGGTIRAINTGANIALANAASTTNYNYGGGMHLRMGSGGAFSVEFAADNLIRQNQGTLVFETEGATLLGGVGGSNAARVIVTNAVNTGVARASALTNGIFPAHLVGADAAGSAFFLENDATTGFKAYSGVEAGTLSGANPTGIANITVDPALTGTGNSIYAVRTTSDVSGGTLRITAIDNLRLGGVLINGSNTISTNLIFDPASATAPGTGIPSEGLVYVKAGESATVSGNVTSNAFTKFGAGTLTLSGASNMVAGDLSIQDGILRVGSAGALSRLNTELNVNSGATLDLNGQNVAFETIGSNNRQVAGANVGGSVTNTSGTTSTLMVAGPVNSVFNGTLNLNLKLVKAGTGTLTINGYSASTPDGGRNTHTAGTDIYGYNTTGGINLNNTTTGLGGAAGGTPVVNLYSGQLGLFFSNGTTGVNSTQGQQFNNQVVRYGGDGTPLTLNVFGPALINVNQATPSSNSAFGVGNIMTVGAMNLTNTSLTLTGGNLYRFRAEGPISILGSQAAFVSAADGPSGAAELFGVISGAGALTKLGDGTLRGIVIGNSGNTYSGGTNIVAGDVQVLPTSGTPLGSGPVRVFPDGSLRIAGNGSVNGGNLSVISRVNAMGAVVLDDNFNPTVLNSTNFSSVYNTSLQLGQPYFTQALNMATIGDGRAYLGGGLNAEVAYMAATLGAGLTDAWTPAGVTGVYRIAPAASSFSFQGVDNVLTGNSYLQVGNRRNMVVGTAVNGGNVLVIRNSNDFTGGTQIASGASLYIETGGRATGETPMGSGAVEVYGELRVRGAQGSLWNANTALATNTINLRPGGVVRLHDAEGTNGLVFLGAGDQGRWGDAVPLDLNGGIFIYNGAANLQSSETIGNITARKGGQLQVFRNSTASSAQLNVGDISRAERGVLTLAYNSGFLGNNITTPLSFERITASTIAGAAIAGGGTTSNGSGVTNTGIVAPWIIDRTTASFVGYDPTGSGSGFQPLISSTTPGAGLLGYNKVVSGALSAGGLVAGDIADLTTAAKTLADDPTVYALRSNQNISPSGANDTLTMTSGGLILLGGTINPLVSGSVPTMSLNFGLGGAGEALIYNSAATTNVYAQINAAGGLTKFGPNQLNLLSINPGIGGDVVINEGTLFARLPFSGSGTPVGQVFNSQDVILNAGALVLEPFIANAAGTASEIASSVRAQALFDSDIYVRGSATLGNNGQGQYARIADLTVANSAGSATMNSNGVIHLVLQSGLWVRGTTTLAPEAKINGTFNGFSQSTFEGQVTGTGAVEKFGNGAITFLNETNNYAGGTIVWGTTNATAVSTVASALRGPGTPFSTGDIQIQPGGLLRIADNANIASNAVYLRSDGYGLGGIGIGHNGVLPAIITTGTPTAGQIKVESTGPFDGVLSLDYGYYSQTLNPASIGNGNWWIGNSQQAEAFYFNNTLGASANGKYLLGGGGNQSGVNYGSVLVSGGRTTLFTNLFTGGTANQVRIEIGAQTGDFAWNSPSFVNGNSGFVTMATANPGLVGDVRVNTNTTFSLGNNFALGLGRLVFNGGGIRYDFGPNNYITSSITLDNDVVLQGDWFTTSGNELVLNGNVAMSDVLTAGATRIWNLTGSGAMAVGLTAGSNSNGVISGAAGSNLIKRGAQQVALRGNNTYQGYTQIDRGEIVVVGNVLPNQNGPLGNSDSPITLGVESANNAGILGIGGRFTVGRDIMVVAAPGTGLNLIRALTNEAATLTGGVSVATGGILTLGAVSGSNGTGSGGRLDIMGAISGAGAVTFGTTAAATSYGGTVGLLGNSNGYAINTYTGGSTFNSTRVEIGGDTLFSGPANNPVIISGPFGTGAMTWTSGEAGNGASFLAVGGARTIVNAFNATSSDSNAIFKFMGNEALTFTRNWDLHSGGTLRNRTLQVNNPYQPVTFSGNFSDSGAQGQNLLKTGSGLLILTGTNTQANTLTTDTNYGTSLFIDDGIVRVNGDAALGDSTTLAAGGSHLAGPADVQIRGGYLSIATGFTTARQIALATNSNGGIDVASGQTLTLTTQTRGAFGIRKVGPGTLALNNSANTLTALTLGGAQQLNPNVGFFSHTGGVVSTTATTGTPFVTTGTSTVTVNSGALSLIGSAGAQSISVPRFIYGASGGVMLDKSTNTTVLTASEAAATAFQRGNTFNSVSYGTLTIMPSALVNLGTGGEQFLISNAAAQPANTALTGGDILSVPSVFVALAGAGQDADFARYDATNGFMAHSVTTVSTLGTSAATNVADIPAADIVGAAPNDIIDIAAVRLAANATSFDGSQTLRINRGGLIFNGATAPVLAVNTLFGTGTGASLTEALVYVRDGQSGASIISGNVSARDFTKTGAGILELSGTANILNSNATRLPVLSVQNGIFRFASAGAQFTNERRPASTTDLTAHYVLNVNEAGIFDLNGITTRVGGLVGNGTVTSGIAGAVTFTSQNGFGVDTTFSGSITDGAGVVGFTKSGNGILILNGHGSYTGGTVIQGGRVTNGTGVQANATAGVLGRLEANTVTALGNGPITLAGGDLRLNGAALLDGPQTTNDVIDGIDVLRWGGVNGYNVTVAATAYSNGVALPSNYTSVLRAASQNASIGSLTINAPQLTLTEGLVMVSGTSTFSLANTVLRTAGGRLFLQGQINAGTNTITKIGTNDVVVSHTDPATQSSVGLWKVYGGILNARSADGAANPLGSNPVVEINGGTTNYGLLLTTDGDGTASSERVTTYANTLVRFGSPLAVSSNEFVMSSNGRLAVDRILGTNDDKTVVVGGLEIRGALGAPSTLFINGNAANIWVEGGTNFERDWNIEINPSLNTGVTLNGVVSGNGSINRKSFSGSLFFNAVNTYTGGTFFTGGGRNLFGSLEGNQVTLSNTAQLGLGHIFLGPLATFQVNDLGNLRAGQNTYVGSNLSYAAIYSLATDASLDAVRLRSAGLGGLQPSSTDYFLNTINPSAAVLALGTIYTQTLDMRTLGDGMWFLGSSTNMVGANGSYDAATLAAGRGDVYRLGAGGATLFLGSNGNANVLTDVDASKSTSLIVGAPMTVQNGSTWNGGAGTVVLLQNQDFTGATTINRNSTLDFRGTLTTSGIETYGVLNVSGEAGTFINPNTSTNIPVTLRPGSSLRFDNTTAGVLPVTATQGRWADATMLDMSNSILRLQGNPAVEVVETVGDINSNTGTNQIQVVRGVIGRGTELRTPAINLNGSSTVQFIHNGSQLGSDERVIITGAAPTVTNGMVDPRMVSASDVQFVTYNGNTGFTIAGFDRVQAGATLASTVTATANRTLFSGAVVLNAGVDFETYALRLDGNVTLGTAADNTAQIVIGSGGLISNGTRSITAGVVAGSIATPVDLVLYNNGTTTFGDFANPNTAAQIVATNIVKFGGGTLQFLGNNAGFTGDIRIQQGAVTLNYRNTADVSTAVTTTIGGSGGNIIFEGAGTVLNLLAGTDGTGVNFTGPSVSFNNSIILGDYVPVATIFTDRSAGTTGTSQNKTIILTGGITFGQSNGDIGQLLRIDGRNGFDLQVNGTVTLNGRSAISVENAYTGTASDALFDGQVTGTGTLIKGPADSKGRELTLRNVTSLNNWTDGTVLQGGTLRIFAKAPNVAANASTDLTFGGISTGDITLMQGLLDLRVDSDIGAAADTNLERIIYADTGTQGPNVLLNGSTQINVDRTGLVAAGTTKQIVLGNLTMGAQWLTVTGGNSYSLEFGGTTTLLGNPYFNNSADLTLNGAINTDGGGVIFNKTNTATLWINSANPTLAANTYINAGLLAFGNRLTGSTTANLGAGDIFINPGAQIQVRGTANVNTGLGQEVVLTGTQYAPAIIRTTFSITQAQLQAMVRSTTPATNQTNTLSIETTQSSPIDMSSVANGRLYLSASGDRTYNAASIAPGLANLPDAVIGGTSTNPVYRFSHQSGQTLTINLSAGGIGNLGGVTPTDVQIGSQAILGPNGNLGSNGFVYFQDQNSYTGQTVVSRFTTLRFNVGMATGDTAGPLGANASSRIDVYGGLRFEGSTGNLFQNGSTTTHFYNNVNFHPLSTLTFQDMTATGGGANRWGDTVGVNLDGSAIVAEATNNADNNAETIGSVIFDRGSRIQLTQEGTGDAFLTAASVTRASTSAGAGTGRGTLVFTPSNTATFGAAATAAVAQTQFISTAPISSVGAASAVSGMLPGYYMESNGNRFVKNGANGITPVVDGDMVAMPTGAGVGNEVVNITAATTMGSFETSIFALRGGAFTLNSPTGANNDATIILTGSGADVGGVASFGAFVINPNLKFGTTGTNEALFYTGSTLTVNGNITAGSITKFGVGGTLVISNDQSDAARGAGNGYQGGWVVNEGNLQFGQFGAAGNAHANNTIVLNGAQAGSAQLNLRAPNPADSMLNYTYTSGRIYAVDFATIDWDPGADDRVHTIADIEIQQSGGIGNAPANGTLDAYLRIANNRNRSILAAGTLTVTNNAILNVDTTAGVANSQGGSTNGAYLSNSISSGMSVASLVGANRLTKWGDGTLYVRGDSSSTFSGPMVIDQGAVFVTHNGSLGTGALTVNRYGVLEVGVANFAPTNSSVTYNEGSLERWSVDNARSGSLNLGPATLQIAANQPTTSASITLNGGGIQAYQRGDDLSGAQFSGGVLRTVNPNVTFTLAGDSFIGDRYYEGANGLDSGKQTHDNRPIEEVLASGALLEIQGVISGSGGLAKVGYDTVILSAQNTYNGTTLVAGGKLMIGTDNALPTGGTVSTTANGVLDLNGQNQTVGTLTNVVPATTVNSTSGFITNSGTADRTLTVGNGVVSNFAYAGVIQHNVALTKTGAATMTLHNANTYTGATHVAEGTLALGANGSFNDTPWINVQGAAAILDVSAKVGGYTFDGRVSGGGTDAAGTTYGTVVNAAKVNGSLIIGDHVGEVSRIGSIAPGANSVAGSIATAGDQIGHMYFNNDLTISGQLAGTATNAVDRVQMQVSTPTVNAYDLGAFDQTAAWLVTNAATYLNGSAGNLAGHDYINAVGTLTINQYGRVVVTDLVGGNIAGGSVFNLMDWGTLTNNGFTVNGAQYGGSGDGSFDLDLPVLTNGNLWDTSLWISHGVVFVVPEPSRALLVLLGLLGLMLRRRRETV